MDGENIACMPRYPTPSLKLSHVYRRFRRAGKTPADAKRLAEKYLMMQKIREKFPAMTSRGLLSRINTEGEGHTLSKFDWALTAVENALVDHSFKRRETQEKIIDLMVITAKDKAGMHQRVLSEYAKDIKTPEVDAINVGDFLEIHYPRFELLTKERQQELLREYLKKIDAIIVFEFIKTELNKFPGFNEEIIARYSGKKERTFMEERELTAALARRPLFSKLKSIFSRPQNIFYAINRLVNYLKE